MEKIKRFFLKYYKIILLGSILAFTIYKYVKKKVVDNSQVYDEPKVYSHPKQHYYDVSEAIYNCVYSTFNDGDKVVELVRNTVLLPGDWQLLSNSYGKKQLYSFGFPVGFPIGLYATLESQLSANQFNKIKQYIN